MAGGQERGTVAVRPSRWKISKRVCRVSDGGNDAVRCGINARTAGWWVARRARGDPAGFVVGCQGAGLGHLHGIPIPDTVLASRTVTWTPDVTTTPRELEREID